ncbi:MAG TPA: hypothetical protein VE824_00145 [Gaiellales bacterium]|nr:hypothetical protein [Gaiellales bacterium]
MGIIDSIKKVFRQEDEEILRDAEESRDPVGAEQREMAREDIEGIQADEIATRGLQDPPSGGRPF